MLGLGFRVVHEGAGVANMLLMRRKEAFDGVKVYTKDGTLHALL
jgi:hypothetical protein